MLSRATHSLPAPSLRARAAVSALLRLTGLVGGLSLLAGCASYQLGTGAKTKFSSLFIAPVTSSILLPQAQVLVTTQVREAFIRDGRVSLVDSPDAADAVLQISLSSYDRMVAVALPADTGLARRFDVALQARATLTDNRSKQAYFVQRNLTAKRGVFTDSGLLPSEYQTLPLLAEQLAGETLHAVLDVW
jgi:hypothetical protein